MKNNFLTPDQLFDFFMMEESPYWVLYNARRTKEVISRFKGTGHEAATADELLTQSWENLHNYLFLHPGGFGKIVLKKSFSGNNDSAPTLYVKWGAALEQKGGAAGAMLGNSSSVTPGGVPPMTERLLSMQEKFYEQRMADQQKVMELLFESREKEATIEGLMQPSLQENLIREGVGVVKAYIAAQAARPQPQLGTLGAGPVPPADPPPPPKGAPNVPFDGDQAARDLAMLQQSLPDVPANAVLRKLAAYASKNPDMARYMLNNLDTDQT